MWESDTSSGPSSLCSSQGTVAIHIIKCQCVLFSDVNLFTENIDTKKGTCVEQDGIGNRPCNAIMHVPVELRT